MHSWFVLIEQKGEDSQSHGINTCTNILDKKHLSNSFIVYICNRTRAFRQSSSNYAIIFIDQLSRKDGYLGYHRPYVPVNK
jgi:hypothetical protein